MLSGRSPFYSRTRTDSASHVMRRIKEGDFRLEGEPWRYVSSQAKSLTKVILASDWSTVLVLFSYWSKLLILFSYWSKLLILSSHWSKLLMLLLIGQYS